MPTYHLRTGRSSTPWNDFEGWLERSAEGKKVFRSSQTRTAGFVVAWWKDENYSSPTDYLVDGAIDWWEEFGDENELENPRQYRTLGKAILAIRRLRALHRTDRIGLVFWTHPEREFKPNERHLLMDGILFPGCPRH